MKKFLSKLHWQVAIALVLAALAALVVRGFGLDANPAAIVALDFFDFIGKLFMRILSMIVVPLVFTSVVCGSMGLGKKHNFLRVGIKTLLFYLATGLAAILLTMLIVNTIRPGEVSPETAKEILGDAPAIAKVDSKAAEISNVLLRLVPPNLVGAASDNTQLLGLIVFAIVAGIFINMLPEEQNLFQQKLWNSFNSLFEKITNFIMLLLPIGVFGLTAPVFMRSGTNIIGPVMMFFLTVCAALFLHMFGTMSLVLKLWKISPLKHLKTMTPAILTAFSTSSSVATLPVTLECVEEGAKVPKNISGFTIPLGATVNMNGSALYECAAVLFIAQIYASAGAVYPSLTTQFLIMLLALLTSIGVAGIPSASLVAIVVIMGVTGIPIEAVGIIWVTDRILDMARTSVNIYGDSCAAVWIAKTEENKNSTR